MSKEKRSYHVISKIGGGWSVRKEGAERASGTYSSKNDAIGRAREIARKDGTDLVIHGRDGRINERATYGRDPSPTREMKR